LHSGNVAEAIARTHPYAVDSASGTEAAPGRKDPVKLRAFFQAVTDEHAQPAGVEDASAGGPALAAASPEGAA
jgi:phosphoribosylanthranilate isomerase